MERGVVEHPGVHERHREVRHTGQLDHAVDLGKNEPLVNRPINAGRFLLWPSESLRNMGGVGLLVSYWFSWLSFSLVQA